MWRSINVQLVLGLVGGHFCLWSLLTVTGSSWTHACWAQWSGWMCHIGALTGAGFFMDRPGFLDAWMRGPSLAEAPAWKDAPDQIDIIENIIEYVFLPHWRSQFTVQRGSLLQKHCMCFVTFSWPRLSMPCHFTGRQCRLGLLAQSIWKRWPWFCLLLCPHLSSAPCLQCLVSQCCSHSSGTVWMSTSGSERGH